jgi:hypothetical protein
MTDKNIENRLSNIEDNLGKINNTIEHFMSELIEVKEKKEKSGVGKELVASEPITDFLGFLEVMISDVKRLKEDNDRTYNKHNKSTYMSATSFTNRMLIIERIIKLKEIIQWVSPLSYALYYAEDWK